MVNLTPSSIITFTGRVIDLQRPERADIYIQDISYALSNLCRFTGHTLHFYSVAEHCIRVYNVVGTLGALLHDAHEAYIGDVSSPLKTLLPDYRALESRWVQRIEQEFGVKCNTPEIRDADEMLTQMELRGHYGQRLLPVEARKEFCRIFYDEMMRLKGEK